MQHTYAQQLLGISNSNYAGVNGVFLNPSSIADSRYGFHLNLGTAQTSVANNYYHYDSPYSLFRLGLNEFKTPYDLRSEYYTEINTSRPRMFDLRAEVRLPSLMVALSPKHSIALTNRIRGSVEAFNVTPFIADDFRTNNLSLASIMSSESKLRLNMNAFRETGLTYARTVWAKDKHFLKVGLTLKYLQGIYSSSLYSDNLKTIITSRTNPNGQPEVVLRVVEANIGYHYTQPTDYPETEWADAAFWKTKNGRGLGADLGFTYEYRPNLESYRYTMDGKDLLDEQKNKYKYRISLSLLDIGSIRYQTNYADTSAAGSYHIQRNNTDIPQQDLTNSTFRNYYPVLNRGLAVQSADQQDGFRSGLPTTLHLNIDYQIKEKFYVNAAWIQSLRSRQSLGMRHNSIIALTPRFETKHFEFSLPLALINNYQQATLGAMIRVGSFFFIGSDNLTGAFNLGNPFGADVYAGITIASLRKKKKDRDKDGVSDLLDACPSVAGPWAFKGCPDTDNDGIEDKLDKCPTEAGVPTLEGCPDKDADGITDALDKCPDEAGLPKNGGCPDSDEDGVINAEDRCPNEKGLPTLKGCPDRDNDGVPDKDDRCPDETGQSKYNGCADTDGDNIPNPDDACPDQAGTIRFNGCPDRDGDTVPDKDDRCPDTYGSPQNAGCPITTTPTAPARIEVVLNQQEQQVLDEAFDNLEFETGKTSIKRSSYESMDKLSALLISKPAYRLLISGHTDNTGSATTNLKISKERAESVKKYLIRKGVHTDQLIAEGFGSRKPIASNQTLEGRQKNRRVEMKIIK